VTRASLVRLVALTFLAAAGAAAAQPYPTKSIRIVVPWPAGGPPDQVGRLLGQRLGEAFKQQVIVDNRPGANSIIGTDNVAKSPPDGYTWLLTTGSHTHNAAFHTKLPYDTLNDFIGLTKPAETAGMVLAVHPSLPAKSVKELVTLSKARPGELTFGSAGNGNTLHLAGELFKLATGAAITHVPYKGAAPALNDLLGGHISMMFASPLSLTPPIRAGKLRGLAQTGVRRNRTLPELPTLGDLGIRGAEMSGWYGLYAPARTPKEIVDRMLGEVLKAVKEPGIQEKIGNLGAETVGMPQDEFNRYVASEIRRYTEFGKRIGLKFD
jgi:tripartite-type tricarboxylate transporter receptor subunit TctC